MNKTILITGANGEIGHGLIKELSKKNTNKIITFDIHPLDNELKKLVSHSHTGDILDNIFLDKIFQKYKFDLIFHLAAVLSTSAEKDPLRAHHINASGSINLLKFAKDSSEKNKSKLVFMFPSSVAVYGIPSLKIKKLSSKVTENMFNIPETIYGCNKLYIELVGNYYNLHSQFLDFRSIRFPGIISADTMPTGGTSDYGPEMLHAAAQNKIYECFVREDSKIPFMVMPDCIKALSMFSGSSEKNLSQHVYNVGSFSISAEEIAEITKKYFPEFKITYKSNANRQKIIDSWPEDIDDSKARKDWNWKPDYDKKKAFTAYLIPTIKTRYI